MHYFTLKVHGRPLEGHFWVLECWKSQKSQFPKIIIFLKNIQRGDPWKNKILSFLFNTEFYYGISKETIRMPFRGLAMLKSTKLIIKGGLCYRFAMVDFNQTFQNFSSILFGTRIVFPFSDLKFFLPSRWGKEHEIGWDNHTSTPASVECTEHIWQMNIELEALCLSSVLA